MEHEIDIAPGVRLWAEERGDPDAAALLLVMGANASGLAWPDSLVDALARHHRVVRYDHRDTGRSSWSFDDEPYALTDLAADAVGVLDALGVERAHVVGMSVGGMLTQLLLLDHPDRTATATFIGTTPMSGGPTDPPFDLDPDVLAMWATMNEPRDREAELDWRVEHWRLLNGGRLPFDPGEFRRMEERIMAHAGRHDSPNAHARAGQEGFDRGAELAAVTTPALVIDSPADPLAGTASARHLASLLGNARLVTVPGLGHALPEAVVPQLAEVILGHTAPDTAGTSASA
ncbi:alpha/beta fold hydrolase [Streptomyces nanshensis]|uniref:Esterase n=1 Tax=Streptomyces nanshensis TaxID=518642 RepID=A0A1E7L5I5_9ACTN|nr:alpha/beta hydrolase [Streptomyces nanshensis]OEV11440.1 esterase [Streptomyces nanshensis]